SITQMRPYADKLNSILVHLLSNIEGDLISVYGTERQNRSAAIVIITSSRGLCGAFNSNIIKAAMHLINNELREIREAGNLSLICIGKRGLDFMRRRYSDCTIIDDYVDMFSDLSFDNVNIASNMIITSFEQKKFDVVYVTYGQFKNAATQVTSTERFLPVPKTFEEEGIRKKKTKADYIFSPDKNELLEDLVPMILQTHFHKYLLDTHASEHGARMTAMDKATENANELLNELKINYNKARQEAITKELSEIVGGAAALNG
ncbi:MAG: ATP synthase F1 subunit gamma, partial [Saprospiraceae bacterium]|nr:ATP synthase F1 subunit gamma [Saprospiraceae bacterium]